MSLTDEQPVLIADPEFSIGYRDGGLYRYSDPFFGEFIHRNAFGNPDRNKFTYAIRFLIALAKY